MNKSILFTFLLICYNIIAQTDQPLNSNGPGNTEGVYAIVPGVFQIEADLNTINFSEFDKSFVFSKLGRGNSYGGLRPSLTLRAGIKFLNSELIFSTTANIGRFSNNLILSKDVPRLPKHIELIEEGNKNGTYTKTNFDEVVLFVGFKTFLYEPKYTLDNPDIYSWKRNNSRISWRRIIPEVAISAGIDLMPSINRFDRFYETFRIFRHSGKPGLINENFNEKHEFPAEFITGRIKIITQHTLRSNITLVTNTGFSNIFTRQFFYSPDFTFNASLNINLSLQWSGFVEMEYFLRELEDYDRGGIKPWPTYDRYFRTGLAYLINNDVQINTAITSSAARDYPGQLNFSVGCTFRLN